MSPAFPPNLVSCAKLGGLMSSKVQPAWLGRWEGSFFSISLSRGPCPSHSRIGGKTLRSILRLPDFQIRNRYAWLSPLLPCRLPPPTLLSKLQACARVHTHAQAHTCTHTHAHTQGRRHMRKDAHVRTCAHTITHSQMHIYRRMRTHTPLRQPRSSPAPILGGRSAPLRSLVAATWVQPCRGWDDWPYCFIYDAISCYKKVNSNCYSVA